MSWLLLALVLVAREPGGAVADADVFFATAPTLAACREAMERLITDAERGGATHFVGRCVERREA